MIRLLKLCFYSHYTCNKLLLHSAVLSGPIIATVCKYRPYILPSKMTLKLAWLKNLCTVTLLKWNYNVPINLQYLVWKYTPILFTMLFIYFCLKCKRNRNLWGDTFTPEFFAKSELCKIHDLSVIIIAI